jgi:hypothetical protein
VLLGLNLTLVAVGCGGIGEFPDRQAGLALPRPTCLSRIRSSASPLHDSTDHEHEVLVVRDGQSFEPGGLRPPVLAAKDVRKGHEHSPTAIWLGQAVDEIADRITADRDRVLEAKAGKLPGHIT